MVVRKQHYVPQFYLRSFSKENNSMVDVYLKKNKKFINTNVNAICQKKFFYDLDDTTIIKERLSLIKQSYGLSYSVEEKIQQNPQYIETVFLSNLEQEISHIIKRILLASDGFELQSIEIRTKLVLFFFNLHERSDFKREKYEYFYTQRKNAYSKYPEKIKNELLVEFLSKPKETQIENLLKFPINDEKIWELVYKYEWTLGIADEDTTLITSDNPAGAFLMKEFCLPISSHKAILVRPKSPNQRHFYKDKKNKKYITSFSERTTFVSNTFQDSNSKILIGNKSSIKKYISLVKEISKKQRKS